MSVGGFSASDQNEVSLDGIDQWARAALAELMKLSGVGRVGIALVEGGGRRLLFTASDRADLPGAADLEWCHVDAYDDLPLNDVIRNGSTLVDSLDDMDPRLDAFVAAQREAGFAAIAAVPLRVWGRVLGGFVLYYTTPPQFEPAECAELEGLAASLAEHLHASRRRPGPTVPNYLPPRGSLFAAHEFPPHPESVAEARRFLRAKLEEWGVEQETSADGELCLSELVTNALIHTHSGCCVQLELHNKVLRIEVHDTGPAVKLQIAATGDWQGPHGRGLQIVDALASRWGQVEGPARAVVWATFDVS
ncbi:MAG: ATP-binding region ATPase domain protein [Marmoricola sp.]|nr:ATP-binding region ATPase domain protein [Marmoricola sp.]